MSLDVQVAPLLSSQENRRYPSFHWRILRCLIFLEIPTPGPTYSRLVTRPLHLTVSSPSNSLTDTSRSHHTTNMLIPFYRPEPAPPGVFDNEVLPHRQANLISRIFFQWVTPIIKVGYSRPLNAEGEWQARYSF